jgi:hypothetical protein
MNSIDIVGQFADLKDTDYKNTLAITVLIDLFIEKGFFTREDFSKKSWELEKSALTEILAQRHLEQSHALSQQSIDSQTSQL